MKTILAAAIALGLASSVALADGNVESPPYVAPAHAQQHDGAAAMHSASALPRTGAYPQGGVN